MADGDGVPMQLLIRCGLGIDGGQEPGMACAPPVPQSVVPVSNFYPNRPVPPWGFLAPARSSGPRQGSGARTRSYAAVVRQPDSRRTRNRYYGTLQQGGNDPRRQDSSTAKSRQTQPTDPQFAAQLVPQDRDRAREPARDRIAAVVRQPDSRRTRNRYYGTLQQGAMIHVDRIPRRPKAGRPNLQIRSLLPRLETGVGGVDGGDNGLQAEQRVREARQAVNRGAVLPESQAQFLEEIVELSSEHGSSTMQEGAPTPRKQRAKSAAPVTTQQPLTDVQPAPSESGDYRTRLVDPTCSSHVFCCHDD
ncbi:hypothetical protein Q5P01_000629 [Channa striata]|uniref:Uncharacterized protein n=1 Tax=Channa striata TaxID=64152 RepID=A0AA88IJX5_CHASR|nr:hypothetical protein Q5P01_000629 [Channa striata]